MADASIDDAGEANPGTPIEGTAGRRLPWRRAGLVVVLVLAGAMARLLMARAPFMVAWIVLNGLAAHACAGCALALVRRDWSALCREAAALLAAIAGLAAVDAAQAALPWIGVPVALFLRPHVAGGFLLVLLLAGFALRCWACAARAAWRRHPDAAVLAVLAVAAAAALSAAAALAFLCWTLVYLPW